MNRENKTEPAPQPPISPQKPQGDAEDFIFSTYERPDVSQR